MHTWITSALLASALLAGSASAAPASRDLDNYRGSYALDDGRTLSIRVAGQRCIAELDGQPATDLVATAPATFASRDGRLLVHFAEHANGSVAAVRVIEANTTASR